MSSLAERIEELSRITQEKIQKKKAEPFIIRGKDIYIVYKDKLPKCPYGDNFFPTLIKDGVAMPNDCAFKDCYYNEMYFPNLKKPGLFSRKKPQKVQVYWVNTEILDYTSYLQIPALGKSKTDVITSLVGEAKLHINVTTIDAVKIRSHCHSDKITTEEDKVLLTFADFLDWCSRVIGFKLGECYQKKMLSHGKYTFVPTGNSRTADDKFSNEIAKYLGEHLAYYGFISKNKPVVEFK